VGAQTTLDPSTKKAPPGRGSDALITVTTVH